MTMKHVDQEEEYFSRMEYERLKAIEEEKHLLIEAEEKKRRRELHFMKCPKCGMGLVTISYKGIQIDRCAGCEGVWLDHGELEAIADLEHTTLDKLFSKVFKVSEA